jgi:hypothetical protein
MGDGRVMESVGPLVRATLGMMNDAIHMHSDEGETELLISG